MRFLAASAQFAPEKAKISRNLDRIAEFIRTAAENGADVVCFPETAVSAYFVEGGVLDCSLTAEELASELQKRLGSPDESIDAVIGFYERHNEILYNSAAYLEISSGGVKVLHVHRKFFLPTYGVFDEERFVSAGSTIDVFETRFGPASVLICEDIWHSISPTIAALKGAGIIYVPSASPARGFSLDRPNNLERYERLIRAMCEEHGIFCVNSMLLGFEGGKGFPGGSVIVDPEGRVINRSPILEEHLLLGEIDLGLIKAARAHSPLLSDLQDRWSQILRISDDISG